MLKKKRRRTISRKKLKEKRRAAYPRPLYSIGNLVQVNDDVMDYNWDDLPLGGWVGEITKVQRDEDGPKYEVRWTPETLEKCHPIYKTLAELEGLRVDEYEGLDEENLHAFAGGDVVLVDPVDVSQYTDRPLDPEDHVDRLRVIFGTKPLEWFPMLGDEGEDDDRLLKVYYEYLAEHLVLPFEAVYVDRSSGRPVRQAFTVEKLIDPDVAKPMSSDGPTGLYCSGIDSAGQLLEVPLQRIVGDNIPQEQLLDDFRTWVGVFLNLEWMLDEPR